MSPPTARTRTRLALAAVVIAAAGFAGGHALAGGGEAGRAASPAAPARFSPDDGRPVIRLAVGSAALPALAAAPKRKAEAKATVVDPPPPPAGTPAPPPVGTNPPAAPPPAAPPPPPPPNPDPQE